MNNVSDTRCKFSHRCRKLWKRRKGKGYMDRGRIRDELRKEDEQRNGDVRKEGIKLKGGEMEDNRKD